MGIRRKRGRFMCERCAKFCERGISVTLPEVMRAMEHINEGKERGEKKHGWKEFFSLHKEYVIETHLNSDVPGSLMFKMKAKGESPGVFGKVDKESENEPCVFLEDNLCKLHGLKKGGISIKPSICGLYPFNASGRLKRLKVKGPGGKRYEIEFERDLVLNPHSSCPGIKRTGKVHVTGEQGQLMRRAVYDTWVSEQAFNEFMRVLNSPNLGIPKGKTLFETAIDKTMEWVKTWYQKEEL